MTRILIIEDEQDMLTGLEHNLSFEDYEPIIAMDGKEGLEKWKKRKVICPLPSPMRTNMLRRPRNTVSASSTSPLTRQRMPGRSVPIRLSVVRSS